LSAECFSVLGKTGSNNKVGVQRMINYLNRCGTLFRNNISCKRMEYVVRSFVKVNADCVES